MVQDLRTKVGAMRHRVVEVAISHTQETTLGSWDVSETVKPTRWASIEPLSGTERLLAGQVVPEATHVIRMRYNTNVTQKTVLRKLAGNNKPQRDFQVLASANVDQRDKILELLCKELV